MTPPVARRSNRRRWLVVLAVVGVVATVLVIVRAAASTGTTHAGGAQTTAGTGNPAVSTDATLRPSSGQTSDPPTPTARPSTSPPSSAAKAPPPSKASGTAGTSGAHNASVPPSSNTVVTGPPSRAGYFTLAPVGVWSALPSDSTCAGRVRLSRWEPRPDNAKPNHTLVDPAAVHRAFRARPVSGGNSTDPRWDSWLLQRVDGQYTGTTDEIFQWAACKWGLSDNLLRAVAVRESTWYQYESYSSGRPILNWGMGDMMAAGVSGAKAYCDMVAGYGRDYQKDFGTAICPRTFSIAGVMSWQDPKWGPMPGNQNGTFPFNRRSTAFAVDYLASQLRGCYNGWEYFLKDSGPYRAGDLWGCVGAWYSGDWRSADANGYISRVHNELTNLTWLQSDWPTVKPSCDRTYGCPVPGIQ